MTSNTSRFVLDGRQLCSFLCCCRNICGHDWVYTPQTILKPNNQNDRWKWDLLSPTKSLSVVLPGECALCVFWCDKVMFVPTGLQSISCTWSSQVLLGHLCARFHLVFSLSSRYRGKFKNTSTNCITGSLNIILQAFLWEAPCYSSPIPTPQLPGFCSHASTPASSATCRVRN